VKTFATVLALGIMSASSAMAGYEGGQFGQNRWPNWYIGVSGSVPFVNETDVTSNGNTLGEVDFDSGYGVGGSIGYTPGPMGNFLDNTRFEFEYFYRDNSLDSFTSGASSTSVGQKLTSDAYMLNAYYDINTATRLTPYLGAGAGTTRISLDVPGLGVNSTDNVFAYQLMAGLGWQPETLLNTVLQVGYKYLDASDPEFGSASGATIGHEYQVHSVEAGARFRF
jgi:OmpA-OmpF porin, OOP family